MEVEYVEKVPQKLREILKNEKLKDYNPDIDTNIPLNEQNLEWKTHAILAMLYLNCWCQNEEEKQELFKAYSINDKKMEEELIEKYALDDLFKKKEIVEKTEESQESMALEKYKEENFIKKLLNRIMRVFIKR